MNELRKINCVKCGGTKQSYNFVKKKVTKCTLCKGNGKVKVCCHIPSYEDLNYFS